jgi:hypothetical protein
MGEGSFYVYINPKNHVLPAMTISLHLRELLLLLKK